VRKARLLIIGHAQHGKDTVAEYLSHFTGLTFKSSSEFAAQRVIFDALSPKYGYKTIEECFADRMNHRQEWFDLIAEYNRAEPARLAIDLLQEADIYVGMRARRELERCRQIQLFDAVIWVDSTGRKPPESGSNELCSNDADFVIENKTRESDLKEKCRNIARLVVA